MMSEELTELAGTLKCLDAIDFKYVRTYASTQVKLTLMYVHVHVRIIYPCIRTCTSCVKQSQK